MTIDLRSDTVTKPSKEMLSEMFLAPVGDDVFEEDPTVIKLEEKGAQLFGKEAGIFCPSGTMTNQIAIKLHTQPGHEVVCDQLSHIYNYEGGGIAVNAMCSVKLLQGKNGRFTAEEVLKNIQPDDIHAPITSLVSIENTMNKGGGACYDLSEIALISEVCKEKNLGFHLDGARVFNALVAKNETAAEHGKHFDTISICLSKGLGAPVGSLLLGTKEHIKKARRIRKVLGGGMRQVGILAQAGIYALDNNISRLEKDHISAKKIEETLQNCSYVKAILPVVTNIVVFELVDNLSTTAFLKFLKMKNILAVPFGPQKIRFVTHLDFSEEQLEVLRDALQAYKN